MRRIDVDRIFELGLLLVTVFAGLELSYASYFFSLPPENSTLSQQQISQQLHSNTIIVNSIFRWSTITIFFLVVAWILILMVPKITFTSPILANYFKRRFAKEFCWCLFGSLFIIEFIHFFALSYKSVPLTGYIALLLAYPLTFFATWYYRKDEIYEMQSPTRKKKLESLREHAYILLLRT